MASVTVVPAAAALGQLSLASAATRREGCKSSPRQCGSSSSVMATMRLGAARPLLPLPQVSSASGLTGLTQGSKRRISVVAKVSETQVDGEEAVQDFVKSAQEAWEKVDDKLAIASLGIAALITLWASTGLVAAIDKLPILPGLFELVGLLYTGYFVYRYLLFKPDRKEFFKILDDAKSKITGQ